MYNVQYTIHVTVSDLRLPQPGGPSPCIYIPQEQGGPVIPPGTGFLSDSLSLTCTPGVGSRRTGERSPPSRVLSISLQSPPIGYWRNDSVLPREQSIPGRYRGNAYKVWFLWKRA
jgi:hypothetical protein